MSAEEEFKLARAQSLAKRGADKELIQASRNWQKMVAKYNYVYGFDWLGRPIIQFPTEILALQEIIWNVKPDLIIETGIAHGGSLIFSASMLELNAVCGGPKNGEVVGIDIEIRAHNRQSIEAHPLFKRISMIEGSSVARPVIEQVYAKARGKHAIMVMLDSNHTHAHVLDELKAYACLVTRGSYCVVLDTAIEDMPAEMFSDRPWKPGNSPKTAVAEYLRTDSTFEVDWEIDHKLQISVAPGGYLRKVR